METAMTFQELRKQIPFVQKVAYLDNASVVPACNRVLEAMSEFSQQYPLNYGVGVFPAAQMACEKVNETRQKMARFINAARPEEIIFTKNTTEAINQIASGGPWEKGDEIILTSLEHQSNMMPWIRLAKERGIVLRIVQADREGFIDPKDVRKQLSPRTKLINVTYVSNIYGTITPVEEIGDIAREAEVLYMIDAAQAGGRIPMNVQASGCDFMAICGRKSMMGPQGTGALYIKSKSADLIKPMIIGSRAGHVLDENTITLNDPPYCFEAGVLNTSGVIGLGTAADVLTELGMTNVQKRIATLTQYMIDGLVSIAQVELYGTRDASRLAGVISWNLKGRDCAEVARELGEKYNVAVASGAQGSLLAIRPLGITGVVRTSGHCFTTKEDIDKLLEGVEKIASGRK